MKAGIPGTARIGLGAFGALLLEAVGFRAGSTAMYITTGLLAFLAILLIARVSLRSAGIGAALISAFTLPWNGFLLGPVRPGDVFIFVAVGCFIASEIGEGMPHIPWWVSQLGLVIVIVAALHVLLPTDPHFILNRIVVGADGRPTFENQSNLGVAFKFLSGIVLLPFAFTFATMLERRALRWLTVAFTAGTSLSGLIGFSDGRGITRIGVQFTHVIAPLSRQAGLSKYPNFLASTCILAMPLAIWMIASPDRRTKIMGWLVLPGIVLGTYATGSRGGAVCLLLGAAASFVFIPRFRPKLPAIAFGAGLIAAITFVVVPAFGALVLKATRLGGGGADTTSASNAVRAITRNQGVKDFLHSPLDGIGMQVAAEAQNVYIQEAASGGLILLLSMLIYNLACFWISARLIPYSDLAAALLATFVASAVFNYLEADLTDRFFYVPVALLICLANLRSKDSELDQRRVLLDSGAQPFDVHPDHLGYQLGERRAR